eukprot:Colp12_sorted_trinity150504_noHs@28803
MNHRTRLDWLFLWSWILRFGRLGNEKIVLKEPLKNVPGAGWAMQMMCFLFLKRRWEEDEAHMTNILRHYKTIKYPVQLLIFPEGTDLCPNAKRRSDAYAEKMDLPKYEFVLHPKTTGFAHCVNELRTHVQAVYDITVGYPKTLVTNEKMLGKGHFPEEIHFHVKRHPISTIPSTKNEMATWVTSSFAEKEKVLKKFYEEDKKFIAPAPAQDHSEPFVRAQLILALIFWASFIAMGFYVSITMPVMLYYQAAVCLFFALASFFGGLDRLEVYWYTANRKPE